MSRRPRRNHTATFKAKVALAAGAGEPRSFDAFHFGSALERLVLFKEDENEVSSILTNVAQLQTEWPEECPMAPAACFSVADLRRWVA
jgi:hypothetical protein